VARWSEGTWRIQPGIERANRFDRFPSGNRPECVALKVGLLSFRPGFSPVTGLIKKPQNRFNGFLFLLASWKVPLSDDELAAHPHGNR
jgi:hypothetical protein